MGIGNTIFLVPGLGEGAAAPFVGLLDTYSGAAAAYSLRKLRAAYSGACIRVRRSSDNTESDIGFNSKKKLNTSALLSFVGAGDGFVTKWYDQSSNNDAVQTDTALQPRIVSSGVVEKVGSKPAIRIPTAMVNIHLVYPWNPRNQPCDFFAVASLPSATESASRVVYIGAVGESTAIVGVSESGSASSSITNNFSSIAFRKNGSSQASTDRGTLFTAYHLGSLVQVGISGTFANNAAWDNAAGRRVFNYSTGESFSPTCSFTEVIIYFSDQSANRAGIDANQTSAYGIN